MQISKSNRGINVHIFKVIQRVSRIKPKLTTDNLQSPNFHQARFWHCVFCSLSQSPSCSCGLYSCYRCSQRCRSTLAGAPSPLICIKPSIINAMFFKSCNHLDSPYICHHCRHPPPPGYHHS